MTPTLDSGSNDPPAKKFTPMTAVARVEEQNGRWVVYLNVQTWDPHDDQHPVSNHWNRINDYSSEQEAQVAASWYERSANRSHRPPTGH